MKTGITIYAGPASGASFASALGIMPRRERQISDIITQLHIVHNGNFMLAVKDIAAEMANTNELTYAMMLYGMCVGGEYKDEVITLPLAG